MKALSDHPEGSVLDIKVLPGARRNEVRWDGPDRLKVCVTQAPEKGKANQAVREVLARALAVRRSQLEIISGHTSSQKRILIRGLDSGAVKQRLQGNPPNPAESC